MTFPCSWDGQLFDLLVQSVLFHFVRICKKFHGSPTGWSYRRSCRSWKQLAYLWIWYLKCICTYTYIYIHSIHIFLFIGDSLQIYVLFEWIGAWVGPRKRDMKPGNRDGAQWGVWPIFETFRFFYCNFEAALFFLDGHCDVDNYHTFWAPSNMFSEGIYNRHIARTMTSLFPSAHYIPYHQIVSPWIFLKTYSSLDIYIFTYIHIYINKQIFAICKTTLSIGVHIRWLAF